MLREALPHHIVLSKLPLVVLPAQADPNEVALLVGTWLGASHVDLPAVCRGGQRTGRGSRESHLDNHRGPTRGRVMQIKQSVADTWRVALPALHGR